MNERLADLGVAMNSFHGGCCRRNVGPEGAIRLFPQQTQPPSPKAEGKLTTTLDWDDNPFIRPLPRQGDTSKINEPGTRPPTSENEQTIRPAQKMSEVRSSQASGTQTDKDKTLKPIQTRTEESVAVPIAEKVVQDAADMV